MVLVLISVSLLGCHAVGTAGRHDAQTRQPVCSVYFSPKGGCTERVVESLGKARNTIRVQAYSFTSQPIAQALLDAHQRGVNVEVILDKSQRSERHCPADTLVKADVPVEIDAAHAIAHNKVMVIDEQTVLTGSFNFTEAAEDRNAENLLVIQDSTVAAQYEANWRVHRQHSKPYLAAR